MTNGSDKLANFIIGGTEKAGTTSVFVYLSQHPEIFASAIKETNFFRDKFSGNKTNDIQAYSSFFRDAPDQCKVLIEASPGYLGEAHKVAPCIHALIPDAKLLFILRDPIDRLYSSYNFHVSKLYIPKTLEFSAYARLCMAYDSGEITESEAGIDAWFLKVLRYGCYAESLNTFYQYFPTSQIKVMFFEELKADTASFMAELSTFLEIDPTFWSDYEFQKTNVTFSSRIKLLHRLAMWGNALTEPVLRKRPKLKQQLVNIYKRINQSREGYDPMPNSVRSELMHYYQPSIDSLENILCRQVPSGWTSKPITLP